MGIRMKKCKYCGNELNGTSEFCCNKCESNYKEALEKGIVLGFLIILYGISLSNRTSAIGIGIIVMGIDVVLLPFTTPETVSLLGYQKSKLAGRLLGILLIAVGI